MHIPVCNLYYLLCYAWDTLEEDGVADVGSVDAPEVRDLMARVLTSGINHLLRRGLERGYVEVREDSRCLRGRVDLQESIKRLLLHQGKAHVAYEELLPDIETNQVLKATARGLLAVGDLTKECHEGLVSIYRALRDVSDIRLTGSTFRRLRLHRNNQSYRFLLAACELIFDNLLADESGKSTVFRDFVRDPRQMRMLFQRFVTNFYARRQTRYAVGSPAFGWPGSVALHGQGPALPQLRTDIVLTCPDEQIVIDTKFTPRPFEAYLGGETLRTSHLYQMYAYLQNVAVRDARRRPVRGILLYPAAPRREALAWTLPGLTHQTATLQVAFVDLAQPWPLIEAELLGLLSPVASGHAGARPTVMGCHRAL